MPSLGGWELVILLGVLVLVFGAKRLPDMARSIGQSARVFKGEMKGMKAEEQPAPVPAGAQLAPAIGAPTPSAIVVDPAAVDPVVEPVVVAPVPAAGPR